jgi:hypothetical protein
VTFRSNADQTIDGTIDGTTKGATDGAGRRLLRHAQSVADTGDRWFVSLAQGLGQIGAWARREKDVVAESAVAAAATTAEVIGPLAGRLRPGTRGGPVADEQPAVPVDPTMWEVPVVSVKPSAPAEAAMSEEPETPEGPVLQNNPPGVLPVLEVLGRVVTDHSETQYSSLQSDNRFWALVRLLQSLTPDGAAAFVMSNDQRPPGEVPQAAREGETSQQKRAEPDTRPGLQLLREDGMSTSHRDLMEAKLQAQVQEGEER